MDNKIILISGGTGVGSTTYSFELAKALGIVNILSTDFIREVIRSIIARPLNPTLDKSTYTAGQTVHYDEKPEEVQYAEIIRGYKTQCAAINVGVEGIIKRAVNENIPLIIEGVHLLPGKFRESGLFKTCNGRFREYHIFIEDEETHKARFVTRQEEAPDRSMEKYIRNFREIRWIHDYMLSRAKRFDSITCIDNGSTITEGLDCMLKTI